MPIKGGVWNDGVSGERVELCVDRVGRFRNCMWIGWAGFATALIETEAHFEPCQGRFHPVLMSQKQQQHQTKLKEEYTFTTTTSNKYRPLPLSLKQKHRRYSLHHIQS